MSLLRNKYVKILLLGTLYCTEAVSQCESPVLPINPAFDRATDYRNHDRKAAECLAWLLDASNARCAEEREGVNAFVLVWLSGHPDVRVEVQTKQLPFLDQHPELLFPWLHGAAECALQNRKASALEISKSGLMAVCTFARKQKELKKDPEIKRLRKALRRHKVEEYLEGSKK